MAAAVPNPKSAFFPLMAQAQHAATPLCGGEVASTQAPPPRGPEDGSAGEAPL